MPSDAIWQAINTGGVLGLLTVILYGGYKRWWVFGWIYREKLDSEKRWQELAIRGTGIGEKAVTAVGAILKRENGGGA